MELIAPLQFYVVDAPLQILQRGDHQQHTSFRLLGFEHFNAAHQTFQGGLGTGHFLG